MFKINVLKGPGKVVELERLPAEEIKAISRQMDLVTEIAELEATELDEIEGRLILWHAVDRFESI